MNACKRENIYYLNFRGQDLVNLQPSLPDFIKNRQKSFSFKTKPGLIFLKSTKGFK